MLLLACNGASDLSTSTPASQPTQTSPPAATAEATATASLRPTQTTEPPAPARETSSATATVHAPIPPTPRPTLGPDDWMSLPVVPTLSEAARQIFLNGLALGNNPQAYSKIGDCESTPTWFLGDFDGSDKYFNLGEFDELAAVIEQFRGSHVRTSLAARAGFNASSVFSPLWANRDSCESDEAPLDCEYRLHQPSFAFIMLGSNDVWHPDKFEDSMRRIIETSLERGVVPILATKADNQEGDHAINRTIAQLAWEYDIPLWNFWAAVQDLPDGGLQEDGVHLTWAGNYFNQPANLKRAWPIRNLTALQTLDSLWQGITP